MSDSFAIPWTVAHQAPLSMEVSRHEYWSGLPFLFAGDLPNPGIEPMSSELAGGFFTAQPPVKPQHPLFSPKVFKKIKNFNLLAKPSESLFSSQPVVI